MDRLEAMTVLLKVVEKGGFSAASRELGIPLATVSRKVSELEAHLGTRLLLRTTRKVSLTDAGASYVASARRILEDIDEVERAAAGEFYAPRGELVLTAPLLFGRLHILPVVTEFLAAYPEIDIRLLLADRNLHLIEDQIDMAVRIGRLPSSGLVATRVGQMRNVVCASPAVLARHGTPRQPQDLETIPCVNFEFRAPAAHWSFREKGTQRRMAVAIRTRLSVTSAEAAVAAASADVGVTRVLHYQCADAIRRGELQIVLADFESDPLPVHLIHAGRGALPTKTRVFIDYAAPRIRERLRSLATG